MASTRMCKLLWVGAGKYTVPVLWDKKENTIVSNESSEIMRMFNRSAFVLNPVISNRSNNNDW